jgi:hypothetical protein
MKENINVWTNMLRLHTGRVSIVMASLFPQINQSFNNPTQNSSCLFLVGNDNLVVKFLIIKILRKIKTTLREKVTFGGLALSGLKVYTITVIIMTILFLP